MAILCVHLGVGPRQSTLYFSSSIRAHLSRRSLRFRRSLSLFASTLRIRLTLLERMREREKGDGRFYEAGHQPAVNVPAGTDGISADEEKENAPPSSLTFPVDPGTLNKMDVLGSRIERNCTVDSLKCHRRRRHGLLDGAPTLMRRNRTRLISTDPI